MEQQFCFGKPRTFLQTFSNRYTDRLLPRMNVVFQRSVPLR